MNKRIISKVGKRHRPDIDMMEFMQTTENQEFDLDKHCESLSQDDLDSLLKDISPLVKKKSMINQKNTRQESTMIMADVADDIEQNGKFAETIED